MRLHDDTPIGDLDLAAIDRDGAVREAAEALHSRGDVLRGGLAAAGALAAGMLLPRSAAAGELAGGDRSVLAYALSLEYLQDAFYTEAERVGALTGARKTAAGVLGGVERAHVRAFRGLLGSSAPARPSFDFRGTTEENDAFLRTAVALEDLSVAAYKAQAPHIKAPAVLQAAVGIHSVEARHAAWMRHLVGVRPAANAFDEAEGRDAVLKTVASTRFIVRQTPRTTASARRGSRAEHEPGRRRQRAARRRRRVHRRRRPPAAPAAAAGRRGGRGRRASWRPARSALLVGAPPTTAPRRRRARRSARPSRPSFPPRPPRRWTSRARRELDRTERGTGEWAPVLRPTLARTRPSTGAATVSRVGTRTPEGTSNILEVIGRRRDDAGALWVRVRLAVLPNGTTGWIPRAAIGGLTAVHTHLVVNLGERKATLVREGARRAAGAGRRSARRARPRPPAGFYIRNKLTRFASPTYGPVAFGTSARSADLTDWPAGGFIGIHGTDQPELLPARSPTGASGCATPTSCASRSSCPSARP